jgi:hypothetical protein
VDLVDDDREYDIEDVKTSTSIANESNGNAGNRYRMMLSDIGCHPGQAVAVPPAGLIS